MNLKECLASAVEQGALNSRQADELQSYYDARFTKNRANMSEAEAKRTAKAEVSAELREKAARSARNALLSENVRKELQPRIVDHKNIYGKSDPLDGALSTLVNYGFKGFGSMEAKKHIILGLLHRDLADMMHHFRPTKVSGLRQNLADTPDLVKAIAGKNVNNPEIKQMAQAIVNGREDFRLRFNRAGGDMPSRQGFDLNHTHNTRKMIKLDKDRLKAKDKWKQFVRPLLDADAMTNPNTGEIVGDAGIDEALDYSWDKLISDGWAHHQPQARQYGTGSISNKYQDARFLQFKDDDAWLAYNDEFGESDVITNIINQFNNMANDIAALETLGPNPEATIEWLKQTVRVEIGKNQSGTGKNPFMNKWWTNGMSAGKLADYRIGALWTHLRGRDTVWHGPAKFAGDLRNIATAANLGSTGILAAVTDPTIAAGARYLAGLPVVNFQKTLIHQMAKEAKTGEGKLRAAKRAIIWEDFLHPLHEQGRFIDQMFGHDITKRLVDRSLTINGLKAVTSARKRMEATIWHEELGALADKKADWIDLHPLMRNAMEGVGMEADGWHKMRGGVDEMGFLHPAGVLDKTGDRALAEQYGRLIFMWGERAVPSGDPRIKSLVTGKAERGTITGETADFMTQYKSFAMSFTARQLEAMYVVSMQGKTRGGKIARGATYFAAMSSILMLGAAFYQQVRAVSDGKEPEPVDNPAFWTKAFIKGGGGGLFADFVDASQTRFGQGIGSVVAGPGLSFFGDTMDITLGNIMYIWSGEDLEFGKRAVNYLGRWTPIISSHPATRLAYRRLALDNLQWLTDPKADQSFKAKARKKKYFSQPGSFTPN
ncbi:MAG: hypothetical protein JKY94_11065 [Rhodobacteraceae bacterium]|nr:hypothetical protein [Paracoccaceae bacterium]